MSSATTALTVTQKAQQALYDELSTTEYLRSWEFSPAENLGADPIGDTADKDDVWITAYCHDSGESPQECAPGQKIGEINELRVSFKIGRETQEYPLPFDLGLDGVPIRVAGALVSQAGWSLVVDFGISRDFGPYLGYDNEATEAEGDTFGVDYGDPAHHVTVRAQVGIGEEESPAAPTVCNSEVDDTDELDFIGFPVAENRCLAGRLGFLAVNVRDREPQPGDPAENMRTHLSLTTQFGYRDKGGAGSPGVGDERLTLSEVLSLKIDPKLDLDVDAAVYLRFRTGVPDKQDIGFPTVVGTFAATWSWGVLTGAPPPPEVAFGELYLDLGFLRTGFLGPILEEIRRLTGPFQPVLDFLTAPFPVISEVSQMVGKGPVTMISLLEAATGADLTFLKSLAAFVTFANSLADAGGYIPLGIGGAGGGFSLTKGEDLYQSKGPGEAAKLIDASSLDAATGNLFAVSPKGTTSNPAKNPFGSGGANGFDKPVPADLPGTFGVPGLTFPFMEGASAVFAILLGQDATLVRYDTGILRASTGFSWNSGPS